MLGPARRQHGALVRVWPEAPWGGVNCIGLGEIPGLQGSPMCKKHQEGFLEEAVGGIEAGLVKPRGRVFPAEGHATLLSSKLSPPGASIHVS